MVRLSAFVIGVALVLTSTASAAEGPSFDCDKARTEVEKIICNDPVLSDLDAQMATTYQERRLALQGQRVEELVKDQRRWLRGRAEACDIGKEKTDAGNYADNDAMCLEGLYQERIGFLSIFNGKTDETIESIFSGDSELCPLVSEALARLHEKYPDAVYLRPLDGGLVFRPTGYHERRATRRLYREFLQMTGFSEPKWLPVSLGYPEDRYGFAIFRHQIGGAGKLLVMQDVNTSSDGHYTTRLCLSDGESVLGYDESRSRIAISDRASCFGNDLRELAVTIPTNGTRPIPPDLAAVAGLTYSAFYKDNSLIIVSGIPLANYGAVLTLSDKAEPQILCLMARRDLLRQP